MPAISIQNWILALAPVLFVLTLMMVFKWGGSRAGVLTWLITQVTALLFFGATLTLLQYAHIKAFILSIDVLLIIWGALFLYQITKKAGTIQTIGKFFAELTENKAFIGIFLGWLFPSFLQGMGGFGVPVAVSAPLLVSAGFAPTAAVVIASIGHGWGVSFGSMGSSIRTMIAVTGFSADFLAPLSTVLLGIACFFSGLLVVFLSGGKECFRKAFPLAIISALILSVGQYLLAVNGLWIISVTVPSMVALMIGFIYMRYFSSYSKAYIEGREGFSDIITALIPYVFLVCLIITFNFLTPLRAWLNPLGFNLYFPDLSTTYGFITLAQESKTVNLALHPGTTIILSALLSFLFLKKKGYIKGDDIKEILRNTFNSALNTSIAIFALVGTASVMNHTGMTVILAEGISGILSREIYPLVSPFIGALGAFITGSNNNSNVLFGGLQFHTAELLNLPVALILAAQTAGGALGSIMAPAKVILGCSTVGLAGKEGRVISKLILYCSSLVLIIGIFTFILSRIY